MAGCSVEISIDHSHRLCYAGQCVSGYVKVVVEKDIRLTGIHLRIQGNTHARWTSAPPSDQLRHEREEHVVHQVHVDNDTILWGVGRYVSDPTPEVLCRGTHWLPFSMPLSRHLPSSFEGRHGAVRYRLRCSLVNGLHLAGDDVIAESTRHFSVLRPLNLSNDNVYMRPMIKSHQVSLRTPLRRPVMIESSLTVPRLGFVPGETIAVVVRVERARRKVKAASLHLVQITTYGKAKDSHVCSTAVAHSSLTLLRTRTACRATVAIPSTVPSRLDGCDCIDVRYEIQLRLQVVTAAIAIAIPVVIGSDSAHLVSTHAWSIQDAFRTESAIKSGDWLPRDTSCGDIGADGPTTPLRPKYRVYRPLKHACVDRDPFQYDAVKTPQLAGSPMERRRWRHLAINESVT